MWAGLSAAAAPVGDGGTWVEPEDSVAKWGRLWERCGIELRALQSEGGMRGEVDGAVQGEERSVE